MEKAKTKDKRWCVYMHTNKINNKVYIGQTCQNPTERWDNGNGYKTCTYFHHAINKYGWDNFEHIIFAENLTKDEANRMEKILIILYNTKNPQYGYNLTDGGEGVSGYKMTEEQKEKIRCALRGRTPSEETKRKIGEAHKGMTHSEETKQILRMKHKKENLSEETINKMSQTAKERFENPENNPFYGKRHSDDAKAKMSEFATKRLSNPENHPLYGKHHTEETKRKLKESSCRTSVVQLLLDGTIVTIYDSIREAERQTKIGHSHISNCCKGKQGIAGGFKWMYEIDYNKLINTEGR